MSAALHLAKPDDIDKLCALCADFHAETGVQQDPAQRRAALEPLLEGSPLGAAYLVGPARAPVGYVIVTFGWSVAFGGMTGAIDEIFVRPPVRRRGIATEVLAALARALSGAGLQVLELEARPEDEAALRLYQRARFAPREGVLPMIRAL